MTGLYWESLTHAPALDGSRPVVGSYRPPLDFTWKSPVATLANIGLALMLFRSGVPDWACQAARVV